jgi:hypothetical protein
MAHLRFDLTLRLLQVHSDLFPLPLRLAATRSNAFSEKAGKRKSTCTTSPLDRDVALALIKTEGLERVLRHMEILKS